MQKSIDALQACVCLSNEKILSGEFMSTIATILEEALSKISIKSSDKASSLVQYLTNILTAYQNKSPHSIRIIILDYVLPLLKECTLTTDSSITEEIIEQYNIFPYPDLWRGSIPKDIQDFLQAKNVKMRLDGFNNLDFIQHLSFPQMIKHDKLSILNAGCGTGECVITEALNYPDVAFTGIDICQTSLAKANTYKQQLQLKNLSLEHADIMTLDLNKQFDIIRCSGVLHHLADPLTGLKNLKKHLKPHGVLLLFVYGEFGRYEISLFQELIKNLIPHDKFNTKINLVKNLIKESPPFNRISQIAYKQNLESGDNHLVDLILNANEFQYNVNTLNSLVTSAGLQIIEFLPSHAYNPHTYLTNSDELDKIIRFNSKIEKAYIADLLSGHLAKHHIVCRHNNQYLSMPHFTDTAAATYVPYLSPYVKFKKLSTTQYQLIFDQTYMINVSSTFSFDPSTYMIDEATYKILSKMDGTKTLCELKLNHQQQESFQFLFDEKIFFLHLPHS